MKKKPTTPSSSSTPKSASSNPQSAIHNPQSTSSPCPLPPDPCSLSSCLLLKHFNRAVNDAGPIPRLRRFILDLAVRGKLVPQDPNDEPTSELLKRIEKEKVRLGKKPKRRFGDKQTIQNDEIPFPRSNTVLFARLEDIADIVKGSTGIQRAIPGPYPLVTLAEERSTSAEYQFDCSAAIVPLISSTGHGHASLKRMHYQEGKFALGNILCAVIPFLPKISTARYIYEYLWAYKEPFLVEKMIGTANVSLTIAKVGETPIPIISPRQQERLGELMALCDELEAAQNQREAKRDRLVATALNALTNSDTPSINPKSEIRNPKSATRFTLSILPKITTQPKHITQLRNAILNLAVQGKLVPQDPNDEPASELLKRIEKEKARLVKAEKIKRKTNQPRVNEGGVPFLIPENWQWVRLGEICELVTSGSRDWAKYYAHEGAIFVRMGNLSRGSYRLRLDHIQRVKPPNDSEGQRTKLVQGDILVSITGDVGMLGLIPPDFGEAYINQHTCLIRPTEQIKNRYLPSFFASPYAQEQFNEPQRGIKNSFRLTDMTGLYVPLPPLAEQHGIVAKVDKLMSLCDELETQITATASNQRKFLESTLSEALVNDLRQAGT